MNELGGLVDAGYTCPKCRCFRQWVRYHRGKGVLEVTCWRCGYLRDVVPHDRKDDLTHEGPIE